MQLYVTLAVAAVLLTACASGQSGSPSAVASNEPAAGTEEVPEMIGNQRTDSLICTSEPVIGTRLPNRRTCRTAEEWKRISDASREETDRVQRGPLPNTAQDGT